MRAGRTVRTLKRRIAFTTGQHKGVRVGFLQVLHRLFTERTGNPRLSYGPPLFVQSIP